MENSGGVKKAVDFFKRHKKKIIIILICAGIAVAAFNIGLFLYGQWETRQSEELARDMAKADTEPKEEEKKTEERTAPVKEDIRKIDFTELKAQNSEITAWIEVPGTAVDYPVVQGEDNVFYLSHDALLNENVDGAVFVDAGNTPGFTDRNTILYGHRMNSGSMFASLHEFRDAEFFKNNIMVYLYFPDGTRADYEIFAAYETGDEYILGAWDFSDYDSFCKYIALAGAEDENANVRYISVNENSRIITLSTCVRGEDEKRYLVQAVLVNTVK